MVDSVTSGRILEQALLQQAELSGAPQGPKRSVPDCHYVYPCHSFAGRVRQKVTQLSTVDSSGEETDDDDDDDDDESIGSMEFPEYVSNLLLVCHIARHQHHTLLYITCPRHKKHCKTMCMCNCLDFFFCWCVVMVCVSDLIVLHSF